MMKIPLISLIFQGIPEMIGLCAVSFSMLNLKLEWKKIVPMGIILALSAYFVRLLPITPGIHTFILIIFLVTALRIVTQHTLTKIFYAVFIASIILAVAEFVFNQLIIIALNINYEKAMSDPIIWTFMGLPQIIILFTVALTKNKYNYNEKKNLHRQKKS